MEETYNELYDKGHVLIAEIMREDLNINANFRFNLTFVNSSMLESTLMMDTYSFLDEGIVHCGENINIDHAVTVVSIVNGNPLIFILFNVVLHG